MATAASSVVMRSGRHFGHFTVVDGGGDGGDAEELFFGVVRPRWDALAMNKEGHCFYRACYGCGYPGDVEWAGMEAAAAAGDRVGMLELDEGSMTVYKNDELLGGDGGRGAGRRVLLGGLPPPAGLARTRGH
jgi:hypothetical protein